MQGGLTQGLGYALHEEVTFTPEGEVAQQGFETYRLPQAGDTLPIQVDLYEGAPSMGPLGAKGAGEIPILNVAAAVACAVANATGSRVQALPLTPPRVLDLLCGESEALDLGRIAEDW
ncbi:molybdopterin cofactor-binding domain-containing protein [Fodinicurvata halophila]|uniref:Molybdopterin cofactor-binding domain-containing protein n=1 Tax=Fodinicurvata halophila TaxID=1419723 RepID=A0ABV8UIP5_9PROT